MSTIKPIDYSSEVKEYIQRVESEMKAQNEEKKKKNNNKEPLSQHSTSVLIEVEKGDGINSDIFDSSLKLSEEDTESYITIDPSDEALVSKAVDAAFHLASLANVLYTDDIIDEIQKFYEHNLRGKDKDFNMRFFVEPLLVKAFHRYREIIPLGDLDDIHISFKFLVKLTGLLNWFEVHDKVILHLDISPVKQMNDENKRKQMIEENASLVMVLYIVSYLMFHTDTYNHPLSIEKDRALHTLVYTYYNGIYKPRETWKQLKRKVVEYICEFDIGANVDEVLDPWINMDSSVIHE